MRTMLQPRVDMLPPAQQRLWPELGGTPHHFVLYGGTALALRLGHRTSADFDFFSHEPLDNQRLFGMRLLDNAETLQRSEDTLTVSVRIAKASASLTSCSDQGAREGAY